MEEEEVGEKDKMNQSVEWEVCAGWAQGQPLRACRASAGG